MVSGAYLHRLLSYSVCSAFFSLALHLCELPQLSPFVPIPASDSIGDLFVLGVSPYRHTFLPEDSAYQKRQSHDTI